MKPIERIHTLLIAVALILSGSGAGLAGDNYGHKIAVHVVPHGSKCTTLPSITTCSDIRTTYAAGGDIDVIPVFFNLNRYTVAEFALVWPGEWGSTDYVRCAGDIAVGGIVHSGEGMATAWTSCQTSWSVAHGYGWLSATGPGAVAIVRNPPTGDYGTVDCTPAEEDAYDYPAAVFDAGVGGTSGDDPCEQVFVPLTLAKDDGLTGQCVEAGDSITYTLTYGNPFNTSDVHNVLVADSLPEGVTFVSATSGGMYDADARTVTWLVGTLAPGESGSAGLVVQVDAGVTASLVNRCSIVSDETARRDASAVSAPCGMPLMPLGLSKTDALGGDCIEQGYSLTYYIDYDNLQNATEARNVTLVDYLPAATNFVSATGGGVYSSGAHAVTWAIGTLAGQAQGRRTVTVAVHASAGSTITNRCMITSDNAPPTEAAWNTDVCGTVFLPLEIGKSDGVAGGCAYQGDSLTYTISYNNLPNAYAVHNVILRDFLPVATEFVSASGGGTYDAAEHKVTWLVGDLARGQAGSREVMVRLTAAPGTTVTNICEILSDEAPVSGATRATTVCTSTLRPLSLAKTAAPSGCVQHGANVTYTLAYDNASNPSTVPNVVLTDVLPGQTVFVSASPGGIYDADAHAVTWNLGDMAAGAAGSQEVTLTVNVAQGSTFFNVARIAGDGTAEKQASKAVTVCGGSTRNTMLKIAAHTRAHPTSCTKGYPVFTTCSQITTTFAGTGDIDVLPVFYDLNEYTVTEFGLEWPQAWGSCSFTRCKGDIAIGGIAHSGEGIAIAWTACQYGWAVTPGFAWLGATGPGAVGICPNPGTGDVGVVNCAPPPGPYYDYPVSISNAGIGGIPGDDPCRPTHIEQTTWGAIKAMFK